MAKLKQPSAKVSNTYVGDAVEKPLKPGKPHPPAKESVLIKTSGPSKEAGSFFLTALASLVLSAISLGFAGFAVWQNSQQGAITTPLISEATKQRFVALEAKIIANGKSHQQAMSVLNQRLDQQPSIAPLVNRQVMAVKIDKRFAMLEVAVKNLAAATDLKQLDETGEIANNVASANVSSTLDQSSLLIVSGLLADNMAGAPLDRWISLLQGLVDQGVVISDLAQLRILATPTPEHPLYLIKTAHELVLQMTVALNRAADGAGFLEKTRAKIGQFVRLREIGVGADGNEAALDAFETAVVTRDLDGAVRAAGRWSGSDLPLLKKWLAAAQSRQSLDLAVSALVTDRLASAIAVKL